MRFCLGERIYRLVQLGLIVCLLFYSAIGHAELTRFKFRDLALKLMDQQGDTTISAVVEMYSEAQLGHFIADQNNLSKRSFDIAHVYTNRRYLDVSASLPDLDWLAQQPGVRQVVTDFALQPSLKQGLALIGANQVRAQFDGSGIAIAIIDSGIDPTHPMLGSSAACDQKSFVNQKVIGGWDTGEKDSLPCDSARHGTSVAGIAAGLIPVKPSGRDGDYVGGVAPGAKIYALKITKANGRPGSNAYLDALRWIAAHWNDDPNNPILVVNNSNTWNKVVLDQSCSNSSNSFERKVVGALTQLEKLGITVFNSAGNSSFTNGIQWPGCMNRIQSVGAVEDTTDRVLASSNSGSLLDFFAPASPAITTVPGGGFRVFGTTSAATPYAAGSAAVIQQAAKQKLGDFLSPKQLLALMMESGDLLTDPKSDPPIQRPRINLGRAIGQIDQGTSD